MRELVVGRDGWDGWFFLRNKKFKRRGMGNAWMRVFRGRNEEFARDVARDAFVTFGTLDALYGGDFFLEALVCGLAARLERCCRSWVRSGLGERRPGVKDRRTTVALARRGAIDNWRTLSSGTRTRRRLEAVVHGEGGVCVESL